MAVVWVKEGFHAPRSEGEVRSKGVFYFITTREVRYFRVLCDSLTDGPYAAARAVGIPALGTIYQTPTVTDPTLICQHISAEANSENPFAFDVTVEYTDDVEAPVNPLSQPAILSGGSVGRRAPVYQDVNGNLIASSAGEPFDPPIMDEFFDATLSIEQNLPNIDLGFWNGFCGSDTTPAATNSDSFMTPAGTFAPGQAKFGGYTFTTKHTYGLTYYTIHVKILGRASTWSRKIVDKGYCQLDSSGNITPILTQTAPKVPINSPQFLNGSGKVLSPQPSPGNGSASILTFNVNNSMAFSSMPFIWS
ncbi:MAG: hypothetical protein ACP5I8_12730 [Phycisphaerae bacterium]